MAKFQPTGIQLHLVTGERRMFYQEDAELVDRICKDLDGHVFGRPSLIIEGAEDVMAIPGHALIGITILTDPLPPSFLEKEKLSRTVTTQISRETYQLRRLQAIPKVEGQRSPTLSELVFISGEHLFLEFSEIAASRLGERDALNHLFSHPSLPCRRLEGGFSIWNTAHIVSWSHYPKLEVPRNAWRAESLTGHPHATGQVIESL